MRQRQQDNFSDLLKENLHENRQAGNRNSIYKQRVARREDRQSVSGDGLAKYLQAWWGNWEQVCEWAWQSGDQVCVITVDYKSK